MHSCIFVQYVSGIYFDRDWMIEINSAPVNFIEILYISLINEPYNAIIFYTMIPYVWYSDGYFKVRKKWHLALQLWSNDYAKLYFTGNYLLKASELCVRYILLPLMRMVSKQNLYNVKCQSKSINCRRSPNEWVVNHMAMVYWVCLLVLLNFELTSSSGIFDFACLYRK